MMATQTRWATADDLARLPDDGFRYELVRGELRQMTPAGHYHGRIAARCTWRLAEHVEENDLGAVYAAETGFLLASDPDTVRAPDVAFVSRERLAAVSSTAGYFPGAPDLVVEVLSPSDSYSDVESKVVDWLRAGARVAIVADPQRRSLTVYRSLADIRILAVGDVLEIPDLVPGWRLAVADVFAD